jgi:hypothetical protein
MRKYYLCVLALLLCSGAAQAAPTAEVFGGYQYTRTEGGTGWNGWNAAITGNVAPLFGITADFSQVYNSGVHFTTYTFGPEVHAHLPLVKPFAHALFGGARASASGVSSTNGFAAYIGGGIDAGRGAFAVRVAQFDWLYDRFSGIGSGKNTRFSAGLVIRL